MVGEDCLGKMRRDVEFRPWMLNFHDVAAEPAVFELLRCAQSTKYCVCGAVPGQQARP
jgi:hypothetical protein